ncbi:hypothetical protein BD626DRAFT_576915 [Schizophyllum amplum]|uniref:Bromo domain-containing protein n=1 Tax=Schizophyllum amplum TaxID=97359 RepID=A0A550BT28_9AGAR|nr:hypothetical protein BD626DRAFT_576915 [Auriculariopsis ampla]
MNNLLRTLRENQKQNGYHNPDLKRLLAEVKAERKAHDTSKLTEPFYESLEGMLHELRTVTIDNHDAEAFLKPVSRADAPDYHEVIQEPMDLQTMLKKVRQRSYKSKREFKDDLDRIWDNCFQYNAAENHPLRKCATRLKAKAECLLHNLTDRKERSDPVIPPELIPPSKANGVNGHSRTPSSHAIKIPIARRNTPGAGPAKRGGNPDDFPNELAVPRTTDGMAEFKRLDDQFAALDDQFAALDDQFAALDDQFAALDSAIEGKPGSSSAMAERLRELARGAMPLFAPGTKRKLDEDAETPPAKRHSTQEQRELHDLWWQANQKSDVLLGNGLPPITHASSVPITSASSAPPRTLNAPPRRPNAPPRRPKKRRPPPHAPPNPKSLLSMMNSNIETDTNRRSAGNVRSTRPPASSSTQACAGVNAPTSVVVDAMPAPASTRSGGDERPRRPLDRTTSSSVSLSHEMLDGGRQGVEGLHCARTHASAYFKAKG